MTELQVIQGGKSEDDDVVEPKLMGSGPKGPDWLRELPYGCRFVCRLQTQPHAVFLSQFGVAFKADECFLLAEDMGGMGVKLVWVITDKFSHAYKLIKVLPEPGEDPEGLTETGDNNDGDLSGSGDS